MRRSRQSSPVVSHQSRPPIRDESQNTGGLEKIEAGERGISGSRAPNYDLQVYTLHHNNANTTTTSRPERPTAV